MAGTTSRSTRWLIGSFLAVVVTGMVLTGVFNTLLAGDQREMVVELKQGAGQPARDELKRDCGSLPGIALVADRGDPDPAVQGRFPVRFRIGGSTEQQQAELTRCINAHGETVRAFYVQD